MADSSSLLSARDNADQVQIFTKGALYKGRLASVKFVQSISLRKSDQEELSVMGELNHENVNTFIGVCLDVENPCTLSMYCQKGSLQDILENDNIQLDNIFKESLIFDLVNGMVYLHNSALRSHGNLKSSNCVIDSRWILKITDFHPTGVILKVNNHVTEYENYRGKLWTAPEILRAHVHECRGSQAGDVFSFSIILQEILFRALPYFMEELSPREIVERVKSVRVTPFRPECPELSETKREMIRLMKHCWEEAPGDRPCFTDIRHSLERISERGKVNIMDRIVQKLEAYSNNLEDIVHDRTVALQEEKLKTDSLLYQMLPSVVADKLKQGACVSPLIYDEATVYFSEIVGFVEMASESTPLEVVVLLNDLYEMLDNLSANFDVYKVETIGDSYMVVSGIPVKNGHRHVAEIADMSLRILDATQTFKIRHRPKEVIQLRLGFHTGPCCAGVVGLSMPRFCLFGDTVNTASRMESNGLALKIHISQQSFEALEKFRSYRMTKRGEMSIKGKGVLTTYWLEGMVWF